MSRNVAFYIDGYNLYYGLKSNLWRKYYWLDLEKLCKFFLRNFPEENLVVVKYFTSRINYPEDSVKRQSAYLEALETLESVKIFYGQYYRNYVGSRLVNKEKKTDVNIAVNMIFDAFKNVYDIAYLITGDSDIVPAVEEIRTHFPEKKIIACFPPNRNSISLQKTCNSCMKIYEQGLKQCQFPDTLMNRQGHGITRPPEWR